VADALVALEQRPAPGELERGSEQVPVGQPYADAPVRRDERIGTAAGGHGVAAVRLRDLDIAQTGGCLLEQRQELGEARRGHDPILVALRSPPCEWASATSICTCARRGAGRPLPLLHGGPGLDGSVFFPEILALTGDGVRLLAIDHRGNGRSDDVADPEGPLLRRMQESVGEIVFRPEVLRHGEYGLIDNRDRLARLRIPVLVLSGELDRTAPAAAAHRLARILRDADEVVIPGAAHLLLQEQPEAALAALRAFLARVPA
jgi:pimeloyl-ACP methyl ester carboxylesterase